MQRAYLKLIIIKLIIVTRVVITVEASVEVKEDKENRAKDFNVAATPY